MGGADPFETGVTLARRGVEDEQAEEGWGVTRLEAGREVLYRLIDMSMSLSQEPPRVRLERGGCSATASRLHPSFPA
jgi:hypothetical protein